MAYYNRAYIFEENQQFENALRDAEKAKALGIDDLDEFIDEVKVKLRGAKK